MNVYEPIERRKRLVFILIFVLLGASIVATGYFYYRHYENKYLAKMKVDLSTVADLKGQRTGAVAQGAFVGRRGPV
jgi:hypothetical protein